MWVLCPFNVLCTSFAIISAWIFTPFIFRCLRMNGLVIARLPPLDSVRAVYANLSAQQNINKNMREQVRHRKSREGFQFDYVSIVMSRTDRVPQLARFTMFTLNREGTD